MYVILNTKINAQVLQFYCWVLTEVSDDWLHTTGNVRIIYRDVLKLSYSVVKILEFKPLK